MNINSKNFILEFNSFKNNIPNFKLISYNNIPINKFINNELYIDFIQSYFIPLKIHTQIKKTKLIEYTKMNIQDFIINIYIYKNKEYDSMDKMDIYREIIEILNNLLQKAKGNYKKELYLTFFFSNIPKEFKKTTKILSPNEINSGFTSFPYNSYGNLYVYRKEEWDKVFIHELIHTLRIDENLINNNDLNEKLNEKICFNDKEFINSHEAATDFLAITYYIMKNSKNKNDFENNMREQVEFMKIQVMKIFNFYNINNFNDILKNNNKCKKIFEQETSVFSYFYLKYLLFNNFDNTWDLLQNNNLKMNEWNNYIFYIMNNNQEFMNIKKNIIINNDKSLRMTKLLLKKNEKLI
jgi:hypothetical protein